MLQVLAPTSPSFFLLHFTTPLPTASFLPAFMLYSATVRLSSFFHLSDSPALTRTHTSLYPPIPFVSWRHVLARAPTLLQGLEKIRDQLAGVNQ